MPFGYLALIPQTYVALVYFDYLLQALPPMSEGGEQDNQKGLKRIDKIG
jgi:hypothetical protein